MSRQGTVRAYRPEDRSADVVLDDGTPLTVPSGALDPAVLLLRRGQRVRLEPAEGAVERAALLTWPPVHPGDACRSSAAGRMSG